LKASSSLEAFLERAVLASDAIAVGWGTLRDALGEHRPVRLSVDQSRRGTESFSRDYRGGSVVWMAGVGALSVQGPVGLCWTSCAGVTGPLGSPVTAARAAATSPAGYRRCLSAV
jgi:hypothetical protein